MKSFIFVFVTSNQEDLQLFLTVDDVSDVAVMISEVPIVTHQSKSTSTSFTIQMGQNVNLSIVELDLNFILEYNVVLKKVRNLILLTCAR